MSCNVCYAWAPRQWEGWHFIDQTAPCSMLHKDTNREYKCEYFSIVPPTDIKRTLLSGAKTMLDSEDLEGYETVRDLPVERKKPDAIEVKEYEHQEETFERFKDADIMGLFLEQGLGKSNIALRIAAYKYRKGEIDSLLIVAPNGVHKQWYIEQIPLWLNCPYEAQLLGGKVGKTSRPFRRKDALHVVVVNIDTFSTPKKWQEIAEWATCSKTFIVLDEATVIKSIKSQRTQHMIYGFNEVRRKGKAIIKSVPKTVARAVLTGTPVTEGPLDLWAIFEFLKPNYFGRNYYSFQAHFGMFYTMIIEMQLPNGQKGYKSISVMINKEIWEKIKACTTYKEAYALYGVSQDTYQEIQGQIKYEGPYKHADELKRLIEPVSMFRTLDECVDMPGRLYEREMLDMSLEQARLYKEMERELITQYDKYESSAASKMVAYIRLQQITSGFLSATEILDEETDIVPSKEIVWIGDSNPKLDRLYSRVETEIPVCPVIIVTRFSAEAARIYDDLQKKMSCMLYTGWKKIGNIEDFQAGKYDVLIANEKAISRGFNLQISHSTHFYSNLFSLEDRLQTEGRTYRIGQNHKTRYTDYLYIDTIDMKVIAALRQKRKLLDYMRGTTMSDFLTTWDEVVEVEYAGVQF